MVKLSIHLVFLQIAHDAVKQKTIQLEAAKSRIAELDALLTQRVCAQFKNIKINLFPELLFKQTSGKKEEKNPHRSMYALHHMGENKSFTYSLYFSQKQVAYALSPCGFLSSPVYQNSCRISHLTT